MKRILLPLALLSLLIPFTTPDRIAAASSPTDGARQSMPVERSQIQTRLEAPSVVNVPVGTPARITVRVTASGGRIPKGRVVLWDVDIPNAATFASHTITLDKRGTATFVVREELPGVPFDVKDVTVYYVPKSGSRFAAATSNAFELGMYLWPSSLAMSLGRNDGNGQAVPLDLSLTSPTGGYAPSGDVTITDVAPSGTCQTRISSAFPFRDTGQAVVLADLPAGQNTVSAAYAGDAYYGATNTPDTTVNITAGGRQDGSCPSGWARLQSSSASPLSGSYIPMRRYGFPEPYGEYDQTALANPNVGTLVVQLDWADVEPQPGVFNFAPADAEVQAAIAQGKQVALLLRFQAGLILSGSSTTCSWNYGHAQLMPRWVGDSLGESDSFCSHGTALTIPRYWGAPFLSLWTAFVDEVAAHFAPDASHIAYVRAPVGLGDEAEPMTGPNSKPISSDMRQLLAWGYTPQLWEAWQEDMLTYYQRAFSYAPWVLYTINHQAVNDQCTSAATITIPTFAGLTVPCTGRPVEVDVAEWAVDHGFGLGQNSLDSSWIWRNPAKDDPPAGDVNTIFAYAMQHTPRPFMELQTFQAESYWCKLSVPTGLPPCRVNHHAFPNVEQDVSYARSHGAGTVEWYGDDLDNPELQPAIGLWTQLARMPGTDRIPTCVEVTPSQFTAAARSRIKVTIGISAPGISGFIPGGTVVLSDDITGKHLATLHIAPDVGTATVSVTVPKTKYHHINLSAAYEDTFKLAGRTSGTLLWLPSTSSNVRVDVTRVG